MSLHPLRAQRRVHGERGEIPAFGVGLEALSTGGGERIELGLAVVVRRAPLAVDEALMLEPIEGGIERTLLDGERASGDLLDAQQHAVAMLRAERDGLEDQQIERAGQELRLCGHVSLLVR